jgi:uncharacterized protein YlxW (UPF0749 family)
MALTVDDLVRFQEAGARIEAEIAAAQAAAAAAQKDAERYQKIRAASETRKLRIIRAIAQFDGSGLDNFIDNLGA